MPQPQHGASRGPIFLRIKTPGSIRGQSPRFAILTVHDCALAVEVRLCAIAPLPRDPVDCETWPWLANMEPVTLLYLTTRFWPFSSAAGSSKTTKLYL